MERLFFWLDFSLIDKQPGEISEEFVKFVENVRKERG
jgi:hypothetical protein